MEIVRVDGVTSDLTLYGTGFAHRSLCGQHDAASTDYTVSPTDGLCFNLTHVPAHVTKPCPECDRLETEYEHSVGEIRSVVGGKFNTVGEKLRELFRWQDVRDKTVKTIHKHKETHALRGRRAA